MSQNPYQSPEEGESTEVVEKKPMVLIAIQGIMTILAIAIYVVWIPHLKESYEEYGLDVPALTQVLLKSPFTCLIVGGLLANALFVAMLVSKRRGRRMQSRIWATLFIVFWILFLVLTVFIAYTPVFAIRVGGQDIWL